MNNLVHQDVKKKINIYKHFSAKSVNQNCQINN